MFFVPVNFEIIFEYDQGKKFVPSDFIHAVVLCFNQSAFDVFLYINLRLKIVLCVSIQPNKTLYYNVKIFNLTKSCTFKSGTAGVNLE